MLTDLSEETLTLEFRCETRAELVAMAESAVAQYAEFEGVEPVITKIEVEIDQSRRVEYYDNRFARKLAFRGLVTVEVR